MTDRPLVSVVMAAYNHERFVGEAIQSVLAQRGVDFEFLIEDDASSDATPDVVRAIRDPRIAFVAKTRNEGAYATHNNLLRRARGEFVAVINSDDVWPDPDKLAYQAGILQAHPEYGATFGRPAYIDERGNRMSPDANFMGRVFEQPNRSQPKWLRRFFDEGNCLCHPTEMIRRECHERLGPYDNRLRQIADFDMWLRVVKHYNIHVSERELVAFRWIDGVNTSWPSARNITRTRNEEWVTMAHALEGVGADLLRAAFGDVLIAPQITGELQLEVEKALLYFSVRSHLRGLYFMIGLEKMHALLGRPECRPVLADYGIDDLWLHAQMGEFTALLTPMQAGAPAPQPPAPQPPAAPPPPARSGPPLLRYLSFLRR